MRTIRFFPLFTLAALFMGCGGNEPLSTNATAPSSQPIYAITVDQTELGGFTAILPDGTVYHDLATYQNEISAITAEETAKGYQVQVNFGPNLASQLDDALGPFTPGDESGTDPGRKDFPLYVGYGYNVTVSTGWTYVSGCVSRNAYRAAVHLNRYSNQVFDLHLATYSQNGYRCFGAYESVYRRINWCTCSPVSYNQVKSAIYNAALAAGVGATIAGLIAAYGTPVAIGALAL